MAKKVVFLLDESMKAAKCGHFIEGTDIEMDIPDEYPLPTTTRILEDGVPVDLRWLPTTNIIEYNKQIEAGFKERFEYSDLARKTLTFIFGRMELDEVRDKGAIEFVKRAGWIRGNEKSKYEESQRTIYFLYDKTREIEEENTFDEKVANAITLIAGMKEQQIRNLYLLSRNITSADNAIELRDMKRHLMDIAKSNPDFIVEKIESLTDKIILIATKALEYKIIDMEAAGMVGLVSPTNATDYSSLAEISDTGGLAAKFDRFVQWLMLDESEETLLTIKGLVDKKEVELLN